MCVPSVVGGCVCVYLVWWASACVYLVWWASCQGYPEPDSLDHGTPHIH